MYQHDIPRTKPPYRTVHYLISPCAMVSNRTAWNHTAHHLVTRYVVNPVHIPWYRAIHHRIRLWMIPWRHGASIRTAHYPMTHHGVSPRRLIHQLFIVAWSEFCSHFILSKINDHQQYQQIRCTCIRDWLLFRIWHFGESATDPGRSRDGLAGASEKNEVNRTK